MSNSENRIKFAGTILSREREDDQVDYMVQSSGGLYNVIPYGNIKAKIYYPLANREQLKDFVENKESNGSIERFWAYRKIVPSPFVRSSPTPSPSPQSQFQRILRDNCVGFKINRDVLPIKFNQTIQTELRCSWSPDWETGGFVIGNNLEEKTGGFALYDQYSEEGGHGGNPALGLLNNIGRKGGIDFSYGFSSGSETLPIKDTSIFLRGQKRFFLRNGEEIFVNVDRLAVKAGDNRLIEIFSKYITKDTLIEEAICNFNPNSDADIKKSFFRDLNNLKSPEKEAANEIINFLDGATIK